MGIKKLVDMFFDKADQIAGKAEDETKRFIDRKILHTRFDTMQDYLNLNKKPSLARKIIKNAKYYYQNSKYLKQTASFCKEELGALVWLYQYFINGTTTEQVIKHTITPSTKPNNDNPETQAQTMEYYDKQMEDDKQSTTPKSSDTQLSNSTTNTIPYTRYNNTNNSSIKFCLYDSNGKPVENYPASNYCGWIDDIDGHNTPTIR